MTQETKSCEITFSHAVLWIRPESLHGFLMRSSGHVAGNIDQPKMGIASMSCSRRSVHHHYKSFYHLARDDLMRLKETTFTMTHLDDFSAKTRGGELSHRKLEYVACSDRTGGVSAA